YFDTQSQLQYSRLDFAPDGKQVAVEGRPTPHRSDLELQAFLRENQRDFIAGREISTVHGNPSCKVDEPFLRFGRDEAPIRFVQREPNQGDSMQSDARCDLSQQSLLILVTEVVKHIEHDDISGVLGKIERVAGVKVLACSGKNRLRDRDFLLVHTPADNRSAMSAGAQISGEEAHAAPEIEQGKCRIPQSSGYSRIGRVQRNLAHRVVVKPRPPLVASGSLA